MKHRVLCSGNQELRFASLGAQVTGWKVEDTDYLWLRPSELQPDSSPIRGGIPLCWPWFGPAPVHFNGPSHGTARRQHWELLPLPGNRAGFTSFLRREDEQQALEAEIVVEMLEENTLRLALTTRNTGSRNCSISPAFHPYFRVRDIRSTNVRFANETRVRNRLDDSALEELALIRLDGRETELQAETWSDIMIDTGDGHTITLRSETATAGVIWNPGPEKAAGMADIPPGGYRQFLCVEPGLLAGGGHELQPGTSVALDLTIQAGPTPATRR